MLALVESADVLLEGMRPGATERLGLGPDDCLARNPRLVYGRMTGWGQDGPLAHTAGHDLNYISIAGALHGLGQDADRPQFPTNLLGDFGGGSTYLVIGVLAALLEARVSGQGQVVDAAIVDGTAHLSAMYASMLASGFAQERRAANLLDGGAPFYDVYETADGRHMSVGAARAAVLRACCVDLLGLPDAARTATTRPAGRRSATRSPARFKERTQAEWTRGLRRHRRLRRAGAAADRGGRAPAPARPAARTSSATACCSPRRRPRFSRTGGDPDHRPDRARAARPARRSTAWGVGDVDALIESGAAVQA